MKAVSFVHRSAYDFLLSPECKKVIGGSTTASSTSMQNDIVQAQIKLLVAAPNPDYDSRYEFRGRLAAVIESISDCAVPPSKRYEFLDELQDLLLHFPLDELEGKTEETAEIFRNLVGYPSKLYRQSSTLLKFWGSCIDFYQIDYVNDRLSQISELNYRGIIYSTVILRCLHMFLYMSDSGRKLPKQLLLITSMLKNLKQLYNGDSLAPSKQSLNFAEVNTDWGLWSYSISWLHDEIPPPLHDDMIVHQISEAFILWNDTVRKLSSDGFSPRGSKPFLADHIEEITALFKAITDPWDIHIDTVARKEPLRAGRIVFFEISVDTFVQYENATRQNEQRGEGQSARPVFESPPKLRVVCVSPLETVKGEHIVKPFKDSVVATYDLEPRVTSRLLKFLDGTAIGNRFRYKHEVTFSGNSEAYEECQQLMIHDVWKNAGGKLDAWQQLYILASLKTRLRKSWHVTGEDDKTFRK
ncbi:hypothetical protein DL95DRAFT_452675 [Leptodontidium sp. 2 PMI_412]|nr:hypothetical protein DL95DRAFT_452675 [Leptodontidium sp. 2 PMI_412]